MNKKLITITIILASIGGCLYWRTCPHLHHIPGATITVLDAETGEPIPNALAEITWSGKGLEGFTIKQEWRVTNQQGKIDIPGQKILLCLNSFAGLSVGFYHPLYEGNGWHFIPGLQKKDQLTVAIQNPPKKKAEVKLRNLDKLLSNHDGCIETPIGNDSQKYINVFLSSYSRYYDAILRSRFVDPLDEDFTREKAIKVLSRIFRNCPEKKKIYIDMLKRK